MTIQTTPELCITNECVAYPIIKYDGFPLCASCAGKWLKDSYLEISVLKTQLKDRTHEKDDWRSSYWHMSHKHHELQKEIELLKQSNEDNKNKVDSLRSERRQQQQHNAFKQLHRVFHERDFRVRMNDNIIEEVRMTLAGCVGRENENSLQCPACAAGFQDDLYKGGSES